jgi:hypothetical protein
MLMFVETRMMQRSMNALTLAVHCPCRWPSLGNQIHLSAGWERESSRRVRKRPTTRPHFSTTRTCANYAQNMHASFALQANIRLNPKPCATLA